MEIPLKLDPRNEVQSEPAGMKKRDSAGHQMLNPSVVAATISVKDDPPGMTKKHTSAYFSELLDWAANSRL